MQMDILADPRRVAESLARFSAFARFSMTCLPASQASSFPAFPLWQVARSTALSRSQSVFCSVSRSSQAMTRVAFLTSQFWLATSFSRAHAGSSKQAPSAHTRQSWVDLQSSACSQLLTVLQSFVGLQSISGVQSMGKSSGIEIGL